MQASGPPLTLGAEFRSDVRHPPGAPREQGSQGPKKSGRLCLPLTYHVGLSLVLR